MKDCEYAVIRKGIYGNKEYAKCKYTGDDCWQFYDKNRCSTYKEQNPDKTFFYRKGNYNSIEDIIESIKPVINEKLKKKLEENFEK